MAQCGETVKATVEAIDYPHQGHLHRGEEDKLEGHRMLLPIERIEPASEAKYGGVGNNCEGKVAVGGRD
ncbi:hypothetical protein MA16_Dca029083 [Dendrobium catenatum]|uniref:Uncharacterized protein n=1 Tax=Dendrobium catenatum TaxID=906689 RepID=A0A2I0V8N9_9ASPA|nr:hypothetical protein MA16_Dca029083 [Dendrobium catenatum]